MSLSGLCFDLKPFTFSCAAALKYSRHHPVTVGQLRSAVPVRCPMHARLVQVTVQWIHSKELRIWFAALFLFLCRQSLKNQTYQSIFFSSSDKPDLDHPLFSAGKLLIMFVNDCYFYRPTTLLWSQQTSKNVQCWKKRHSFIIFDPLKDHFWINTDTQQRVFYVLKSFKPFTSHLLISNINLSVLVFLLVFFYLSIMFEGHFFPDTVRIK